MIQNSINLRPTRAEISLEALRHNFSQVKKLAQAAKIMAVVKAEAYGHGLVRMASELAKSGADYLGVSFLEEGVALREAGIETPILVMGGLVEEQIARYLDFDLILTVSSVWKAKQTEEAASRLGKRARVHLKFDTGIGRVGQQWQTANLLLKEAASLRHLELEGIYTHFASSESDDLTFTYTQLERFHRILDTAHQLGIDFPLIHCANSGALIQLPDQTRFTLVRPGLMIYGYTPAEHLSGRLPLIPILSLRTNVVYVKMPPADTPIGYGSTWRTPGGRWIATLPIGYGDGFPRRAGNRADVLLRGRHCRIVGNVSMDQITVDAGIEAYLGDEALLFGQSASSEFSLWELCRSIDAIPYEVLCGLTLRVPRVYL
jgi:alanine racemase